jgi:thiamine-monophosphate kinase
MARAKSAPKAASHDVSRTGELALIDRIRRRAEGGGRRQRALRLGIGDDCAILSPPAGHEIVVTTDMSLEGKHFRRDWHPPQAIGHRALARGLSDLAAMGAGPLAAFLSLALPRSVAEDSRWVDGFLDGLLALAETHRVPLAGGDTSESPANQILVDIVVLGSVVAGKALRRSGARPGDRIFVTGALGGAAAELAELGAKSAEKNRTKSSEKRLNRKKLDEKKGDFPHLFPQPRTAVGRALAERGLASACIDISDGLSTDLSHLCESSGVAAEIAVGRLPLHRRARALGMDAALEAALNGGEDYELLFTAPAAAKVPRTIDGVPLTCIGGILRAVRGRPAMSLVDDSGGRRELKPGGWEHLR